MSPPLRIRMTARAVDEPHRTASQLELLFDLTFVIAVAALTARFAHAIADGHALDTLVPFLLVFFAIWWAWTNYTWFASSFDTDDVPFRLLTMAQMGGVLVLAAGVPAALDHGDFYAVTVGYVIMRVALVAQWLRVAVEDPASRATALRFAIAITIAEAGWLSRLVLDESGIASDAVLLATFLALVAVELSIPVWAERAKPSTWHPHHIAERHGLFAIILLGEGVLAASLGIERAAGGVSVALVATVAAALLLVFALWWLYFLQPAGDGLAQRRERAYIWGYGHYGLFAGLAAVGAGLEVAVEQTGHELAASNVAIGYAVAIPVAVVLLLLWGLHAPICRPPVLRRDAILAATAVVLALPLAAQYVAVGLVVAAIAATCSALVALTISPKGIPWSARSSSFTAPSPSPRAGRAS